MKNKISNNNINQNVNYYTNKLVSYFYNNGKFNPVNLGLLSSTIITGSVLAAGIAIAIAPTILISSFIASSFVYGGLNKLVSYFKTPATVKAEVEAPARRVEIQGREAPYRVKTQREKAPAIITREGKAKSEDTWSIRNLFSKKVVLPALALLGAYGARKIHDNSPSPAANDALALRDNAADVTTPENYYNTANNSFPVGSMETSPARNLEERYGNMEPVKFPNLSEVSFDNIYNDMSPINGNTTLSTASNAAVNSVTTAANAVVNAAAKVVNATVNAAQNITSALNSTVSSNDTNLGENKSADSTSPVQFNTERGSAVVKAPSNFATIAQATTFSDNALANKEPSFFSPVNILNAIAIPTILGFLYSSLRKKAPEEVIGLLKNTDIALHQNPERCQKERKSAIEENLRIIQKLPTKKERVHRREELYFNYNVLDLEKDYWNERVSNGDFLEKAVDNSGQSR